MISLLFALFANADVLFIDLNNAPGEVAACSAADPGRVWTVNQSTMKRGVIDAQEVENAISRMEAAGKSIDSIVISGHDGNGQFFGGDRDENTFTADQLQEILSRYKTKKTLKTMALWGCYGGNVAASENHWLNPGLGAKFTIAFPLQSPNKNHRPSQELLGQFCDPQRRAEAERAAESKDALCQFYKNMPMLRQIGASVSNCNSVATNLYGKNECYSYEELHARCAEFDVDQDQLAMFKAYMAGSPGYENPPLDGSDVFAEPGKTPVRRYYDQAHLWLHCASKLKDFGYDMPHPAQIVRLVKYAQIRDNLNALNRRELEDYDRRLDELGLGDYALGDLRGLSRADLNARINGAYRSLWNMASRGEAAGDTRADVVWRMARGLKSALVDLQYKVRDEKDRSFTCSHYTLVHAGQTDPRKKSQCILSYEKAMSLL